MTQQDLADAAGIDLKTVYNLESGTRWPIARTRAAVAAALEWGADALDVLAAGGAPAGQDSPGDDYGPVEIDPTERMGDDLGEVLPAVRAWARAAGHAHPGTPLRGADVFPPSMPRAIWWWDYFAAHGIPQDELPAATAVSLARDEQKARAGRRQGHAAGLIRAARSP